MDLVLDASAEDLKVFLAEAEELLALLDANVLILERGGRDQALLQEIFRAAHTLKGSSAAIGHQRMANLTHLMESVLDKVRKRELQVTTEIVDLLLECLDALRILQEEVVTLRESEEDFTPLVRRLAVVATLPPTEHSQEGKSGDRVGARIAAPRLSEAEEQRLRELQAEGRPVYVVAVEIDPASPLPSARCLQVVMELSALGEVVATSPAMAAIETEGALYRVEALVATAEEPQSLRYVVGSLVDVASVEMAPYIAGDRSTEPAGASTSAGEQRAASSASSGEEATANTSRRTTQTVRIDVERLDKLMNLVGELVIDRTRLARLAGEMETGLGHDELAEQLGETSLHIARLTDELQQEVMKSRLVPVASVFARLPRLVRDLAQKTGKRVEFTVEGQDTELDRSVIQEIGDPLLHLLRNAIDHGVETPEQRLAAGKPEIGHVRLSAYHEESYIVIVVEDDGRGIDVERVKASAVAKGLISPERADSLAESEALDLIFYSGLSTAEQVSDVSGRGVGMDIVRTNIEKLGGAVTVTTQLGRGTRFTIRLPVTLAIIPALLVGLGDDVYAIPLTAVNETLRVEPERISSVCETQAIQLRGRVLPLLHLRSAFGQRVEKRPEKKALVVSVRFGGREVGLVVDSLLGQQEVVIKSLGGYLGDVHGISGATILGDGRVGLIVDVPTLVETVIREGTAARMGARHSVGGPRKEGARNG